MCTCSEHGLSHPFLSDPAMAASSHWRLSTSQLAVRNIFVGFGPVVPDGYGVCYQVSKKMQKNKKKKKESTAENFRRFIHIVFTFVSRISRATKRQTRLNLLLKSNAHCLTCEICLWEQSYEILYGVEKQVFSNKTSFSCQLIKLALTCFQQVVWRSKLLHLSFRHDQNSITLFFWGS
jgi:hypothetical protein